MKKEEFLKKLKEKLEILEENEINDIIEEYNGYIEEKIQHGKSEKEAIKDFGDIDELATELLKAYKINVEKKESEKNWLNNIVDKFSKGMDEIICLLGEKDGREIFRMIIEIIIILLAIGLCKIPFKFLTNLGFDVFMVFRNGFGKILFQIWQFIMEFTYLIFAIVLFIKIFQKRYINYQKNSKKNDNKEVKKNKNDEKKIAKKDPVIIKQQEKKGIIDGLASLCILFLKFLAVWILLGIGCYIIGLGICLGISIFLMFKGVNYYGIYLSILILLILGILAFIWLFNWIVNRKSNIRFLLTAFIISFITLGISFSYASLEVASTEFIDETTMINTAQKSKTLPFNGDEILIGRYEYISDELLTNEIKIVYEYNNKYFEIEPDIQYEDQNRIYLSWFTTKQILNSKLLEEVIQNLKDKKIYNYSHHPKIIVYTSSENIKRLEDNATNWKRRKSRYTKEDCYELQSHHGFEFLPSYCKTIIDDYEDYE